MATQAEILERVSALLGRRDLSQVEHSDWMAGPASGGPAGDGLYPLTDGAGFTRFVASPEKVRQLNADEINRRVRYTDLSDRSAGKGAALVALPAGGEVSQAITWVTPQMFGAIGDGDEGNAEADTIGMQAAVNSGRAVVIPFYSNLRINREIRALPGRPLLICGEAVRDSEGRGIGSRLTAVAGFTGFMLRPSGSYDLRDITVVGSSIDGCYGVGSPDTGSTTLARMLNVYVQQHDIGVYFGGNWQHPFGLEFIVYGVGFRTGAIHLGGFVEPTGGESAWSIYANVNGSQAGSAGAGGISASDVVVTATSDTADTITWTDDAATRGMYGWCVMRAVPTAPGVEPVGWHVPPNWTSPGLVAGTFAAIKAAGETWLYRVVRMSRGIHIRRGKVIAVNVAQSEYFGIGLYVADSFAIDVRQFYTESRNRVGTPLPGFCGIYAARSNVDIGGGWIQQLGYGLISAENSRVTVSGALRGDNCRYGVAARGNGQYQSLFAAGHLIATGTTPAMIVSLSGSVFDYNGYQFVHDRSSDPLLQATTLCIDGPAGGAVSLLRRGVEKVRAYIDAATAQGVVKADRFISILTSKTINPTFTNTTQWAPLTIGSATAFLDLVPTTLPANGAAALQVTFAIDIRDEGLVVRQTVAGVLHVALCATPGDHRAGVVATFIKAIQAGTMTADPVFSASVAGGVVTLSCLVTTDRNNARIYCNAPITVGAAGAAATLR